MASRWTHSHAWCQLVSAHFNTQDTKQLCVCVRFVLLFVVCLLVALGDLTPSAGPPRPAVTKQSCADCSITITPTQFMLTLNNLNKQVMPRALVAPWRPD